MSIHESKDDLAATNSNTICAENTEYLVQLVMNIYPSVVFSSVHYYDNTPYFSDVKSGQKDYLIFRLVTCCKRP